MNRIRVLIDFVFSKFTAGSVKEMGWVIFGQAANVVLSFGIVKILSGMGKEDYGHYALILSAAAFTGIIFGPLQQGFVRFYYHFQHRRRTHRFVNYINKMLSWTSLGFVILTAAGGALLTLLTDLEYYFIAVSGLFIVIFKLNEFYNSVLNLIRKRRENYLLQSLEKVLIIISLFVLLQISVLSIVPVLVILTVYALLFYMMKAAIFRRIIAGLPDISEEDDNYKAEIKRTLFQYIMPFLIWGAFGWVQLNGEKWIINGILTTSDVGVYAIMMAVINALVMVPNNIINEFITPIIYKQYADLNNKTEMSSGYSYIKLNVFIIALITVLPTLITALWGKELIILISSEVYADYWYLLPVLAFGAGLFLTGQSLTLLGLALNMPKNYIYPKILAGILSVIFNLVFITYYGLAGAAYASLLTGIVYVIHVYIINIKIRTELKRI